MQDSFLAPPLFLNSKQFARSGRTLGVVSSPRSNTRCVYPAPSQLESSASRDIQYESNVYLVGQSSFPLRSQLVSDTYVQWVKTREFFENEKLLPDEYRPLLPDMLEGFSMTLKGHIRRLNEDGCPESVVEHYQSLDAAFDLFLLLNAGKSDPGVFGEDLLDWINRHYISPTSEEGTALADLREPWTDPQFWPVLVKYAYRAIIPPLQHFLKGLSVHPSKWLPSVAKKLISLLNDLPRAVSCTPSQFGVRRRDWIRLLGIFRTEFDGLPASAKQEDWYPYVSDMLEIFEGDELVIKRIGREFGVGWLEVVCVWGLWGDDQLERQHLPDLVEVLSADAPPDPNDVEDKMLYHLFADNLPKAIKYAMELDVWLGSHLADIIQAEGLIPSTPMENQEMSLRDYCLLEYAEAVLNDPGQWMIAVDYMQSCGNLGLGIADEVLYHIPLDTSRDISMERDPEIEAMHVVESDTVIPLHIVKFCREHKREWVLENVIRTAARLLADSGRLGESLSYSLTTEDQSGIDRVVSFVMERYQNQGRDSLIDFVNELPPAIQTQYRTPGPRRWQSLSFLLNYAQFHIHHSNDEYREGASHLVSMLQGDFVPFRWWPVIFRNAEELLTDESGLYFTEAETYEIMRKLEILCNRVSREEPKIGHGSNKSRTPQTGPKAPYHSLRLALAKYIGRLVMSGQKLGP